MAQITNFQLRELVNRTRTVLNNVNEAADDGEVTAELADLVEDQLAPVFRAANTELVRIEIVESPVFEPEPVAPRARY